MASTYTIAHHAGHTILAIVPDGQDAMAEALRESQEARLDLTADDIEIEQGLELTDDLPDDHTRLFWTDRTLLEDEAGNRFHYAIRADAV